MKYIWRILVAKEYLKWRKQGRPCDVRALYHRNFTPGNAEYNSFNKRIFGKTKTLRMLRLKNPAQKYPQDYVNMSRNWQIKARLNYGRY